MEWNYFADAIAALASDLELCVQDGVAARRYVESNLDLEVVFRRFEEQLVSLAGKAQSPRLVSLSC